MAKPVTIRGFEAKNNLLLLWALLPLAGFGATLLLMRKELVGPGMGIAVAAVFLAAAAGLLAWAYHLATRRFPVALTEEGILVDHPSGKFEIAWKEVTGAREDYYFTRYWKGFHLTLSFGHKEKQREIQLGYKRAPRAIPLALFKVKVRMSQGYDEAIAYLRSQGVKVDTATTKLADDIEKAKAKKLVVRR